MEERNVIMARIWNFTAGPAHLPESVIEICQAALMDVGIGVGIAEISHRSSYFDALMYDLESQFRRIGNVPDSHDILFLQGGATLQFCTIPETFSRRGGHIDCIHTGYWTRNAMRDAAYYTTIHYAYDGAQNGFQHIPEDAEIAYSHEPDYVYYCANNSFLGTEFKKAPRSPYPLVADMSSNIFSRPIDVGAHKVIFASAQKNLGIAGCCVVILDRDFLASRQPDVRPSMLDYRRLVQNRSMLNTPPTFALFVMKQMLDWIEARGGLVGMAERNAEKAGMIRRAIDASGGFYRHVGDADSRSMMNISFYSPSPELDALFVKEAEQNGMIGLRGHRETGGLRASIFNAFPREGCGVLADFIVDFAKRHG